LRAFSQVEEIMGFTKHLEVKTAEHLALTLHLLLLLNHGSGT